MSKKNYMLIRRSSINRVCWANKNPVDAIVGGQSMYVLMILENIKETRLKFSRGSITDGEL